MCVFGFVCIWAEKNVLLVELNHYHDDSIFILINSLIVSLQLIEGFCIFQVLIIDHADVILMQVTLFSGRVLFCWFLYSS